MTGATPARWPDASGKAPTAGPRAKAALGRRSSGKGLPGGERDPVPVTDGKRRRPEPRQRPR